MQTQNQKQSSVPVTPVAQQQESSPFRAAVVPNMPTILAPVEYPAPQAAMAEGGLLQEGGSVDPVSGNEVPAGSLKEEVRDDIPAKLSEGEFVFPADVVRFIGLERLMQIRQAAKEGLAKMESMGQMGNADEATEDDIGEFETEIDDIIEEVDREYAEGGVVTPDVPMQQAPAKPTMDLEQAVPKAPEMTASEIIQEDINRNPDPERLKLVDGLEALVATNMAAIVKENNTVFFIAQAPSKPRMAAGYMFTVDSPEIVQQAVQDFAGILQKAGIEGLDQEISDPQLISLMPQNQEQMG